MYTCLNDLNFKIWRKKIEEPWKDIWITVYEEYLNKNEDRWIYSALIPEEKVRKCLEYIGWDIHKGYGLPDFGKKYVPKEEILYLRYGNFDNIEPLVFDREFHNLRENYIEFSQEFIHYFNLFYDEDSACYIKILSNGNEEKVIIFQKNIVQVKLKYLKEYAALKKSKISIYFEIRRASDHDLSYLNLKECNETRRGVDYIYNLGISSKPIYFYRDLKKKSSSNIIGKKILPSLKNFKPSVYREMEGKGFEEFIVGIDINGKKIMNSCNNRNLEPKSFLQPVFFRKQVL